jgi:hypothetical protein
MGLSVHAPRARCTPRLGLDVDAVEQIVQGALVDRDARRARLDHGGQAKSRRSR